MWLKKCPKATTQPWENFEPPAEETIRRPHTEKLPGPWTMGGAGVIIVGSLVIAADSHQQSTTVELKQM